MKKIMMYVGIGLVVVLIGSGFLLRSQNVGPLSMADDTASDMFSSQAIGGYDAVAYFVENAAVTGSVEFQHEWQGTVWNFKNKENLTLFQANPEKYAPQYGGHCAFAVGQGFTAGADPQVWSIVDDKLYLNINTDAQADWKKDQVNLISSANTNWSGR